MIPLLLLTIFGAAQFVQPKLISESSAPSGKEAWLDPKLDPTIATVLKRSCSDCHSNLTAWPWYSRISPVSWWLAKHVKEGREHLNMSNTTELSSSDIDTIADNVKDHSMPLPSYLWIHRNAKLSEAERKLFDDWANGKLK